jgi:hypothetical protein
MVVAPRWMRGRGVGILQSTLDGITGALGFTQTVIYVHNILEPTTGVTFFNSGFKCDPTELFPSIVLVIASEKRFPPPNFNLKVVRIQCGNEFWMLLDALLHC